MTPTPRWSPWNPPSDYEGDYYATSGALNEIARRYLQDPVLAEVAKTATRYVSDQYGDLHPRVLFIGEAPGEEEDKAGQPFVGLSGRYLDRELEPRFINRKRHYTTNVVKHRPVNDAGKNRTPTPEEIDAARPFLLEEIDVLDPPIIVTLGNTPLKALWPDAPGITSVHGRPRVLPDGRVHLPAVHPSYAMRATAPARSLAGDLDMLAQLIAVTRRVVVTGSRSWPSPLAVQNVLDKELAANGPFTLVHGACEQGPDSIADEWARVGSAAVRIDPCSADWTGPCRDSRCTPGHRKLRRDGTEYCPFAGHVRNQQMLDSGRVERVHAFRWNGSSGTGDCIDRARAADLEVIEHEVINDFQDESRFLSNFWLAHVRLEDEDRFYPSVEHAYQAAKTADRAQRRLIWGASTPGEAKKLGGAVVLRPEWEDVKRDVMADLVWDKFARHPEARERLLATGDAWLEEGNTWGDRFWGTVGGAGRNELGLILMEVRAELRRATLCPGCDWPLSGPNDCPNCEYFNLLSGRYHYCGRPTCYCRELRRTVKHEVLERFIGNQSPVRVD